MATSKVYYCSLCEDKKSYNRKQYFTHTKTEGHKNRVERSRQKMPPSTVSGVIKGQGGGGVNGLKVKLV